MNYKLNIDTKFDVPCYSSQKKQLIFYSSLSICLKIILRNVSWEKLSNFQSLISEKFEVNV